MSINNVGLFQIPLQKVCIIFQALSTNKPKYGREKLYQMHILDLNIANPVICKAYIANVLVNLQGLPYIFYKMYLILEHQNRKFKWF